MERERNGWITTAWYVEYFSRTGKDFPKTLAKALPKPARREPAVRMSEDEIFRNLDRHLKRADTAARQAVGRPPGD